MDDAAFLGCRQAAGDLNGVIDGFALAYRASGE